MTERTGPWSQTFTGRRWWPLEPRPEDVCIEDIAHALSNLCRFGGHSRSFYSVAQHSVIVSWFVPPSLAFHGLLHDAAEAYVGDVIDPVKRALQAKTAAFTLLEGNAEFAIASCFRLAPLDTVARGAIRAADRLALMTERRDLLTPCGHDWPGELEQIEPDDEVISPWAPAAACQQFLDRFEQLRKSGIGQVRR